MFNGEYTHSIDEKGRSVVPAKFRESLGDSFMVTRGFDNCLFVYPMDEWARLEENIMNSSNTSENSRKFQRFFFGGATQCEVDKQGRINIPPHLREHAGLTKDIVSVGVLKRVEIWDKKKWMDATSFDDMDAVAESMAELGINI